VILLGKQYYEHLWRNQQWTIFFRLLKFRLHTNVVASNITQTTTLSWDAVTTAASYKIYNGTAQVAATTSTNLLIIIGKY
jgi:hypothetical protein